MNLYCGTVTAYRLAWAITLMNDAVPLVIVNATLNKAPDAVATSFERDLTAQHGFKLYPVSPP